MRTLMRWHRHLSCAAAPMMLFFAVSGVWQVFRLHESRKDGSYEAPALVARLSDFHKVEHLSGPSGTAFRLGIAAAALVFAASAVLGVLMALRVTRPRWLAYVLLALGAAVPVALYWSAGVKTRAPSGETPSTGSAMVEPQE